MGLKLDVVLLSEIEQKEGQTRVTGRQCVNRCKKSGHDEAVDKS